MMKILVVEDEAAIRDLISINLSLVGYEVFKAEDGLEAKEFLESNRVDLILLDVMIPGIDGFSLIEKIKKYNIPVIFVTAKESVLDRVKGLRLGAEDYIVKPFETIELLARIEVILRRYNKDNHKIKFENVEVDTNKRIVKLNDKEVYLTAKEYDLLILFLQNRNMALSREQILDRVWGFEYVGETRTVDIHVQRIREKLDLKNSIKTVFKVGYRLEG
ncbi:response regulator transcription factor [Terrisporobacter glycolicus]|nr:response regulator [Terrisporobacter glycolicus]